MPKKVKTKPVSTEGRSNYPRHTLEKVLRIPLAILSQNAGKPSSKLEAAKFVGIKGVSGEFSLEVSSATKYGIIDKEGTGVIKITDLGRKILRPTSDSDKSQGLVDSFLKAPVFSDVYLHYRGEYIPEDEFFNNALESTFKVPKEKIKEFKEVFLSTLKFCQLSEEKDGKVKLKNDVKTDPKSEDARIDKLAKAADIKSGDSCFVVMPFANPIGSYYAAVYEPAIKHAGLLPIRADNEIFGTGKIIDQIYAGITASKVLVAELTGRNPNVFYELGVAHALKKPVVLVSAKEEDVPFDVRHIRVIYYDVSDPFWGSKLIDKVSENILSALKNPEEAIIKYK